MKDVMKKKLKKIGYVVVIKIVINGDKWIILIQNGKMGVDLNVHHYGRHHVHKYVIHVEKKVNAKNQNY